MNPNGSYHRCICGRLYSDSDGGCCDRCPLCDNIAPAEDIYNNGMCDNCAKVNVDNEDRCVICGEEQEEDEFGNDGVCLKCIEEKRLANVSNNLYDA